MKRKALIIGCDDTASGPLSGPSKDISNICEYLKDYAGGCWTDSEIDYLLNPTKYQVEISIQNMSGADYTFVAFSGHGCVSTEDLLQYFELKDGDISINNLVTDAPRQLIISDACRGFFSFVKAREAVTEMFSIGGVLPSVERTRATFDAAVMAAERGISVCYSSSPDESSADSEDGGAYISSLLTVAKNWFKRCLSPGSVLTIEHAHQLACVEIKRYLTIQKPCMQPEKRRTYFPFAVRA